MIEARYYEKRDYKKVRCNLCPHNCIIGVSEKGFCLGRENRDGILYAVNYGEVVSIAMDPIEKKPLYHFYPGKEILSIATYGCNMRCPFCQNWEISQNVIPTNFISPERLLSPVEKKKSFGVAYTYTEPMIWFEYIMDSARLLKQNKYKVVLVTNGMINKEPLSELVEVVDGMNIDLKSMDKRWYSYLKGDLNTVLHTIRYSYEKGISIEVTNLIVTDGNDSIENIKAIVDFISSISTNIPIHFSRYFPHYRYSKPATSVSLLKEAYKITKEKLNYVYVGNVLFENGNDTFCPECGNLLVKRFYYRTDVVGIEDDRCLRCGRKVDIVLQ